MPVQWNLSLLIALAKTSVEGLLFLFAFDVPLAEFSTKLSVIMLYEYNSLNHKPRPRLARVILQYAVIIGLIQFAFLSMQIPNFAIGWCDT